jgi:alpha 1,2-mannosyltransferase
VFSFSLLIGHSPRIRWYALRVWDYFEEANHEIGTNYQFIMRMDEESFFHSRIDYDLFHFMSKHGYEYAYRICSYEMNAIQQIFHNYTIRARLQWGNDWNKIRLYNGAYCGFYNNWFIGKLSFFQSEGVQHMLAFFDKEGYMYRDRLNDLVIQTAAVYSFCPTERIHRFLDWSYEHFTLDKSGCPLWGALTTGYMDQYAEERVQQFVAQLEAANCTLHPNAAKLTVPALHVSRDSVQDLSPSYHHLPPALQNITLLSVKAGKIDLPNRGERSG